MFKTIVPLDISSEEVSDKMSDNKKVSDNAGDKMSDNAHRQAILAYLVVNGEVNATMAAELIGRSPGTARRVLTQLVGEKVLVASGANRNRKYRAAKKEGM